MIAYQTKYKKVSGTSLGELKKNVFRFYNKEIKNKTKRRPYIRSAYFNKEKIFFDYYWDHLWQKSPKERMKRLKYFKAMIDVVKNSKNKPSIKNNPNNKNEVLYRFAGLTRGKEIFFVQIKENKKSKKYLMSCFSPE